MQNQMNNAKEGHQRGERDEGSPILKKLLPSWASLAAQRVKNLPAVQETWFHPWVRKIP